MGPHGWQWLLILAVILLLFGAAKLPALAKSVGQSARVFRGEMKAMKNDDAPAASTGTSSDDRGAASSTDAGDPPRSSS
ncbi:twin-arginine translocase TatA/TatE family subunit [Microbacterium dauci]|uniref:Sec-independent protein translocase protein TatA n=1 Tax=Microbacterium dauci TaxID=3048008 RepID=A0ABT6ZGG2_9MICO|nr:twin-arginine translocase TatA/TatE family subunit [Microbacterium sp. LX3-4]MDJ1115254.1 twin-arginine translocase TatA/TatE family subunit [Microbacterium sp. LX3-4]